MSMTVPGSPHQAAGYPLAMGWPNILSPHDTGLAIEDVWPTLFFSCERVAEMRRKIGQLPWAAAAFAQWQAEAETVLPEAPQLPIEPIGWRHDFYSPTTAEHLLFDPRAGNAFVDPWDQAIHLSDQGGLSRQPDARHRAWVLLVHERTYRLLRSLGLLYALTGDERYATWVAAGLRRAVAMFRRQDFRERHRHQALYFQPLYDAQVLALIANAYDLTRASVAYTDDDHRAIVADIFAASLPHQMAFLDAGRTAHNMLCYVAAALGLIGDVLERREWRTAAFAHPRGGFFALLRDGLRRDADGKVDGFWIEGTQFYHLYSTCPLLALYDLSRREPDGAADPHVAGLTWADVGQRVTALLRAPVLLTDEQFRLPCFGDLGAPKHKNLRLYRHLYEVGAGVLDPAGFGPLLAQLYAGGLPRNSLAAVAYGPDQLADLRSVPEVRAVPSVCLPASGIAVLRATAIGGESAAESDVRLQVWLRSGANNAGHDHMDRLALGLHAGGEVIATDLGTAGYSLSEFTRYCRSSFAHNTLIVDEQDQQSVQQAHLRFGPSSGSNGADGGWAVGVLDDAYPGVSLERRVAVRAPYVLLEDHCTSVEEHRFGWVLHVYGSLAVGDDGRIDAGLTLAPLPEDGPWAWFTNRRSGARVTPLRADWRVRDNLWLRLWMDTGGPYEWTAGQTPGNPIPDRQGTLLIRATGRDRRFRAMLEVHRGAATLTRWDEHAFVGEPFARSNEP